MKKDEPPSVPGTLWTFAKRRFGRAAATVYVAGLMTIAAVSLLYATFDSWKNVIWPPPTLEVVSTSSTRPGSLRAVLRNRSTVPVVISAIALRVDAAAESKLGTGQGSSIPVMGSFDATLTPQHGLIVNMPLRPVQIPANAVEELELRVDSRASVVPARVDYTLTILVTFDGQMQIASPPVATHVFVLR